MKLDDVKPLPPSLPDAPVMVLGHYFKNREEFMTFARLGSAKRHFEMAKIYWRIDLWLRAQNQNVACN